MNGPLPTRTDPELRDSETKLVKMGLASNCLRLRNRKFPTVINKSPMMVVILAKKVLKSLGVTAVAQNREPATADLTKNESFGHKVGIRHSNKIRYFGGRFLR